MRTDAALQDLEWAGLITMRRIFGAERSDFVDRHYPTSTSSASFDDYRRFAIMGELVVTRQDVLLNALDAEQDGRFKYETAESVLHELGALRSVLLGLARRLEGVASETENLQRHLRESYGRMKPENLRTTRVQCHIRAPRAAVYRLLVDPAAIVKWKVPDNMTAHVHSFEAREGGSFRVSLTYADLANLGKTTAHTDTYHGRFLRLVTDELVVDTEEFETSDPAMGGEMISTITLADADDGGTDLVAVHEGLPPGIALSDNETGWRMALAKLAALVEAGSWPPR